MRTASAREIELISVKPILLGNCDRSKKGKYQAKSITIAEGPVLYFHRCVKSVLRKMIRKICGEVSVFSLLFREGSTGSKITWVQQRQHHAR